MRRLNWTLLLFVCLFLGSCGSDEDNQANVAALNLPLQTLAGEEVNLSDYAGNVILVNFWATWCGPCRVEMPELEAYYQAHQDKGFVMLAVNAGEPAGRAQGFIDEGGYTFPVMLDLEGEVANFFGGVRGMPSTFVLDQNGELAYQHVGLLDRSVLEAEVTPLLP